MSATTTNLPGLAAPPAAWKDEVSARVRAHRNGRGRVPDNQPALPGMEPAGPSAIAARVAERYARVPSWREAMAAEAAAKAAAALTAAAPAKATEAPAAPLQSELIPVSAAVLDEPATQRPEAPARRTRIGRPAREAEVSSPPLQPDLIRYSVSLDSLPAPRSAPSQARVQPHSRATDAIGVLEDPIEEATVEPTSPLPARVIEFPRELVAPRKARPRLALGPLLEEERLANPALPPQAALFADSGELRILEADSEVISSAGRVAPTAANMPEWHSIHLDSEQPMRAPQAVITPTPAVETTLYVAPMQDRLMSAVVDVALTLLAFLAFVLVFAVCTPHLPTGKVALAGAGATLLATWGLYQFLFFSLSSATPGMRYAKIALCTFDDENPSRTAMRARIAALLLSALPLGLGFLWSVFDDDGLCWHDRITETYQRSYREL
ncbi:MAG TPA: RDD family protein [Acidobacteriaceae bacterium]|nr:RDD family protein [Acidobacteriaceae bacterium]